MIIALHRDLGQRIRYYYILPNTRVCTLAMNDNDEMIYSNG